MKTFTFYAVYAMAFFLHIALYCNNDQKKKTTTTQKNPPQLPQQTGTIPAGDYIRRQNSSKSNLCNCTAPHNAEIKCSNKRHTL